MQWRVMVELTRSDGDSETHEVHVGGGNPSACSPETLGLTLKDASDILAGLQDHWCGLKPKNTANIDGGAHAVAGDCR